MRARRVALASIVAATAVLVLSACGIRIPADPDGSLDRIVGGDLRAGAVLEPGLVDSIDGAPTGELVELIEAFAAEQDAAVTWTTGSEETLVGELETGGLDLVIGGMTTATPWVERAGVSRGYPGIEGAGDRELVVLVPLGENRLLSTLETFLDEELTP